MDYVIPFSDVIMSNKAHPWFGVDCGRTEVLKHEAYLPWVDARDRKTGDVPDQRRACNKAA